MAIDTTGKKLSLLNYMRPDLRILPEANGSISNGDALHLLNLYSFGLEDVFVISFARILSSILDINATTLFSADINRNRLSSEAITLVL